MLREVGFSVSVRVSWALEVREFSSYYAELCGLISCPNVFVSKYVLFMAIIPRLYIDFGEV